MLTLEKLKECGVNINDGMKRCMNNEAFYLRLVNMALDDGVFEERRCEGNIRGGSRHEGDVGKPLSDAAGNPGFGNDGVGKRRLRGRLFCAVGYHPYQTGRTAPFTR